MNRQIVRLSNCQCFRTVVKRTLIGVAFFILHSSFFASTCQAQSDSTKVNKLTLGLSFLGHGEICAGGLPKPSARPTLVQLSGGIHH